LPITNSPLCPTALNHQLLTINRFGSASSPGHAVQVVIVVLCKVFWEPLGGSGHLEERLAPGLCGCAAVAAQQLMQVGIHLLQLRPGEIRQLGNDLLCAHVDILSEKPNMEKQKLGKQKVEIEQAKQKAESSHKKSRK
jgi:hypothetical protein